eukprot:NODE_716_length_2810_cov_3.767052.p1 GENE.NODE_716_length_2810_cov_3.767052~~NODE_716_length_2810_cov_3.767052.p1  ORF type:complete len:664 (-),score=220.63 NODE_716_length_2810_cov_3.767052:518-2509(-)
MAETTSGAIAVHCRSGLGRTATLIGAYAIRHLGFGARSFIGWARMVRPGTVHGSQQQYLCNLEPYLRTNAHRHLSSLDHRERLMLLPRRELRFWALDSGIPAQQTHALSDPDIAQLILTANGLHAPPRQVPAIAIPTAPVQRLAFLAQGAAPMRAGATRPGPAGILPSAFSGAAVQGGSGNTPIGALGAAAPTWGGSGNTPIGGPGSSNVPVRNPSCGGSGSSAFGVGAAVRAGGSCGTPVAPIQAWGGSGNAPIGAVGAAAPTWGGSGNTPIGGPGSSNVPVRKLSCGGSGSTPVSRRAGATGGGGSTGAPPADAWASPALAALAARSGGIASSPSASLGPPAGGGVASEAAINGGPPSLTSILAKMSPGTPWSANTAPAAGDVGPPERLGATGWGGAGDGVNASMNSRVGNARGDCSLAGGPSGGGSGGGAAPVDAGGGVDDWGEVLRYLDLLLAVQTSEASSWGTVRRYVELLRDYHQSAPKDPPMLSGGSADGSEGQTMAQLQSLRRQAAAEAATLDHELQETLRQARTLQRECEQLNMRLSIERDEHAAMVRNAEVQEHPSDDEDRLRCAAREVETLQGQMLQKGGGLQPWQIEEVSRLRREISEAKALSAACAAGSRELRVRLEVAKQGSSAAPRTQDVDTATGPPPARRLQPVGRR